MNESSIPVFNKVEPPERSRTYVFAGGHEVTINNVSALAVGRSGTHRLETSDGKKAIIPFKWIAIKIDVDKWSF